MITWPFPKLLGNKNERELGRLRPLVSRIREIEDALQREPDHKLTELTRGWQEHLSRYHPLDAPPRLRLEAMDADELRATAAALESRLAPLRKEFSSLPARVEASVESIEAAKAAFLRTEEKFAASREKYLNKILPEAYAVVKNGARRLCGREVLVNGRPQVWNMVHFDVQLIGGIALHRGLIAEMQTGEGKTLVATLPVYLNALTGLGVHVVTVNDYLAKRDSDWMGALFQFLGLTVGCLQNAMPPWERRQHYARDITYGTNSEFGFDYLRDNGMASTKDEQVQRGHYLAILDEVDSILIDDARTPLIITGPAGKSDNPLALFKPRVEQLVRRQTELCNGLAAEARRLLQAGDTAAAGIHLYKLKLGQPRHRQFLRFMENPELRRLLDKTELRYQQQAFRKDIHKLKEELFFAIDEKGRDADLMDKGRKFLSPDDPESFTLPDFGPRLAAIDADPALTREQKAAARQELHALRTARAAAVHGISQLLKAYCLHERDVHYVVRDGKVTIIDESTGREMPGRRWSDGLHQAVETKEGVKVEEENRTFATITLQNYFRLYTKLAGMTGTAETEAAEFHDIYRLDVLPIPTHLPNRRTDANDQLFKTRREKYQAVIAAIQQAHATGQPVLVGTASVESSETLSRMLKRAGIPHSVLNAKLHEQEAAVVAAAGQRGAVTVSTNMAGRGTDIKLGEGVAELGGLFVIGTERQPSRRVDRQLRGRCSRQGDPGRSQFFLSLEDDLMRHRAAPVRMAAVIEQAEAAGARIPSLGKLVEEAQRQAEQHDAQIRKRVLDFDDVMNLQREIVYGYRNDVIATEDIRLLVHEIIADTVASGLQRQLEESDETGRDGLVEWIRDSFGISFEAEELSNGGSDALVASTVQRVREAHDRRVAGLPAELVDGEIRRAVLHAIDSRWQEHLADMDELREGVYLRSQGQKDPLVEYKNEAFGLFHALMDSVKRQALVNLGIMAPAAW